jgi:hypothetical protein
MTLPSEQLAEGVGDVHNLDISGVDHGLRQCQVHDLGGQSCEIPPLTSEVACEIALVSAQDPDIADHSAEATTAKRVAGRNDESARRRPRRLAV